VSTLSATGSEPILHGVYAKAKIRDIESIALCLIRRVDNVLLDMADCDLSIYFI
jgi:hypothetical protein